MSTSGGAPAALRPDADGDLSDGILVQTQLLGRVLGVRLLRVDGTVLLTPARLVTEPGAGRPRPMRTGAARTGGEQRRTARAVAGGPSPTGSGLAEAARLLSENAALLRRRA